MRWGIRLAWLAKRFLGRRSWYPPEPVDHSSILSHVADPTSPDRQIPSRGCSAISAPDPVRVRPVRRVNVREAVRDSLGVKAAGGETEGVLFDAEIRWICTMVGTDEAREGEDSGETGRREASMRDRATARRGASSTAPCRHNLSSRFSPSRPSSSLSSPPASPVVRGEARRIAHRSFSYRVSR